MQSSNRLSSNPSRNLSLFYKHYFLWGFSPENVILVIFFARALDSYALAGVIFMLRHLAIALFELPAGIVSDYLGRRKTLIISGVFYILLKICYILACFYSPLLFLLLSSLCYGLAESFISGTNQALLYETLEARGEKKLFHARYGRFKAFHTLALAVSGLLGGIVASAASFEYIMFLSLAGSIGFLAVNAGMRDVMEHEIQKNYFRHALGACRNIARNKKLWWFAWAEVVNSGGNRAVREYMPSYLESLIPYWAMGVFRFFNWFLSSVSSWFSSAFAKMWGLAASCKMFAVSGPVALALALAANGILTPFLVLFEYFAHGASHAIGSEIKQKEFDPGQRATMESIISIFGNVSEGLVSLLVGVIAQASDPRLGVAAALAFRFAALPALFKAFACGRKLR